MALRAVTSNGVAIAPSSVSLPTGGTLDLYNTADQTTNYERLRADWSGNVARLFVQSAGSGTDRDFRVGTATLYHVYQQRTSASPLLSFTLGTSSPSTNATGINQLFSGGITAASGTQTPVSIAPTINQSGTAGYTALDVNPTESATGSGAKLLQRWAVGGTAVGQLYSTGFLYVTNIAATSALGISSSLGGSIDVALARDAADILALRRGTNAQTFRVYNTYTDGSNYERGYIQWSGNQFCIGPQGTGTGSNSRDLVFQTGGASRWYVNGGNGNFLAATDNTYDIGASGANRPRELYLAGGITHGSATLLTTTTALTNGAAAATGTLTNAPTAGNPTKWIPINDNGTTRYIPAW